MLNENDSKVKREKLHQKFSTSAQIRSVFWFLFISDSLKLIIIYTLQLRLEASAVDVAINIISHTYKRKTFYWILSVENLQHVNEREENSQWKMSTSLCLTFKDQIHTVLYVPSGLLQTHVYTGSYCLQTVNPYVHSSQTKSF